jgi:predicted DNA-binding protein
MTTEDTRRLEAIQSTVASDGWKYLVEDIEQKIEAMKEEFLNPNVSLEALRFGQGRIQVYKEFLSLKQVVDAVLDQAKEEAAEDAVDG